MLDKKQVLNVVFGVALVLAIISCFTFFMEFVNMLQLKDMNLSYDTFGTLYTTLPIWRGFVIMTAIAMVISVVAITLFAISHFKQNAKLKKVATVLIGATAITMLITSIFAYFVLGNNPTINSVSGSFLYTLMYGIKVHAITAAASFAVLFGCLIIHTKTKNKEE